MQNQKPIAVMARLTRAQAEAIDAWRRLQPDIPTRPEAIRRLAEIALASESQRLHKKAKP
jgi:hypothetical protein